MRTRSCNLELQLQPSDDLPHPVEDSGNLNHDRDRDHHQQQQQQQQLTIFYNGQVCVCDVSELQARAIIMLARREMMGIGSPSGASSTSRDQDEEDSSISPPRYSRATLAQQPQKQMPGPPAALSMKRSLQRFLQKRRHRVLATNPYNVR